jgi:hypothetical protein
VKLARAAPKPERWGFSKLFERQDSLFKKAARRFAESVAMADLAVARKRRLKIA